MTLPRASAGGRIPLAAIALAGPALLLVGLATGAWWLLLALAAGVGLAALTASNVRLAFVVGVLLCTFVDYTTGMLTIEMTIVVAWFLWTFLLLYWRSAWKGWVRPPAELLPPLIVWSLACFMGVVLGFARGNNLHSLGIELEGALWPFLALAMIQVFRREHAAYALAGLFVIGLLHTGFGLTMLRITEHRLGGIYFTTVTGFAAVLLWTVALLTPHRRVRRLCLVAMVPMLIHLLFSFTRGYWLGALAGLATTTILAWRSLGRFGASLRDRLRLLVPIAWIAAATVALAIVYFGSGRILDAIGGRFGSSFSTQVSGETMSNAIRLVEYDSAIAAAVKSPVVGNGFGYHIVVRDPVLGTISDHWFVHDYYLLLWLKLGVVGLAAFGYLIWRQVRAAKRVADRDASWIARVTAIGAIAVTVQILAILITNYSLADVTTASVFAYVWGFFWAVRADQTGEGGSHAPVGS
ncbi:MAG: O-antigen ligase family protein [Bacteroidota bacterium]